MKSKKQYGMGWKFLIILTLIISIVSFFLSIKGDLPQPLEYDYEILHLSVNNSNDFEYINGEIVEYLCDENVEFSNRGDAYYISTIIIPEHYLADNIYKGYGECILKIKRLKDANSREGEQ